MTSEELCTIADILLDFEFVKNARRQQMNESINVYKGVNVFLGYCSQLKEYTIEFEALISKIMLYRKEIITRYKDILIETNVKMFKALLIPPLKTYWYTTGVRQYKKMRRYCIGHYRKKIQQALNSSDERAVCDIIDTILIIDKHYDIYKKTIQHFINRSETFAGIMTAKYTSYIQL